MDSIDLLKSVAKKSAGDVKSAESVRSTIRQARKKLNELEETVRERHGLEGESAAGDAPGGKPKSEFSRQEKADFFQEQREKGNDPNEQWDQLPE